MKRQGAGDCLIKANAEQAAPFRDALSGTAEVRSLIHLPPQF